MFKLRKLFLAPLFILAFASSSQAYSLREGNILLAEYGQQVTGSVGAASTDNPSPPPKLKSPYIAFTLASIPLMTFGGLCVWGEIRSNKSDHEDYRYWPTILLLNAIPSVISTLPAHFYTHDSALKVTIITLGKIVSLIPSFILFQRDFCYLFCDDHTLHTNAEYMLALTPWIGLYLYELIDAPLAAKRYNEKVLQQSGLFVVPMAAPGEGRLLVGYRF